MTAEEKKKIIRAAWLRENGHAVPFFSEAGENLKATRELLSAPERDLARQEQLLEASLGIEDYSLPSLKPNLGIGVMAVAFGCPYVLDESADPWVKPIITDANPEDVSHLQLPDPRRSGLFPQALARIDFFNERGRFPLRCVNIPSPLLTASLVWEYGSFLAALLMSPRQVHLLLEKITAATLDFLRVERERIRSLFAYTHESVYIPADLALRVSDDVAAVLTGELYREFGVRYNNALAEEYGGLVVHSCGNISRSLPAMMETKNLLGIDLVAPQNDLSLVKEITRGRTALCLRYFDWDFPTGTEVRLLEYGQRLVELFGARGILLWTHTPTVEEARRLSRSMRRACEG